MRILERPVRRGPTLFVLAGLLASLFATGWLLRPFWVPMVWAAILAGVCLPWTKRLTALLGGRRRLASGMACFLISAVIILPFSFLIVILARESAGAYAFMQELLRSPQYESTVRFRWDRLVDWLYQLSQGAVDWHAVDMREWLLGALKKASGTLMSLSSTFMSRFLGGVLDLFVMIVTMYVLFLDGPQLLGRIRRIIPLSQRQQRVLLQQFTEVSTVVLYGSFLTALAQGFVGGMAFWVLGLPSPLVWGAAMSAASLIPVVGAGLIWVPTALYLLFAGAVGKGMALIALGIGAISMVDNVVRIFVLQGRVKLHILLVFLSILGGLQVFGLLGLVLGPLLLVTLQTFLLFYEVESREADGRRSGSPRASPR